MTDNGALNEKDVRRIVREEVAPIRRRMGDKRLRALIDEQTEPIRGRLTQNEKDIALLMAGYDLTRETINDRFGRIEEKLDAQHGAVMTRLDNAEGWITRRTRLEKSVLQLGGAAVVAVVKRWLPFVALVAGVLSLTYVLLMVIEG